MSKQNIDAFKAISNFISDLASVFTNVHGLALYNRLIGLTLIEHASAVEKHISIFKDFCVTNRDSIMKMDHTLLVSHDITYSEVVTFNLSSIINKTIEDSDNSTKSSIWKHLLSISMLVDPTSQARAVLKETIGNENDFLTNVISKIESVVDPNADAMTSITSIMASGVFTELITTMGNGLSDGSLDLQKLMGSVQNMVSKVSSETSKDEQPIDIASLIKNSGKESGLDFASMLGPLMSGLSTLGKDPTLGKGANPPTPPYDANKKS